MSDDAEILTPNSSTSYASLAEALAAHAIALPPEQLARLDAYRALLWEWNAKLNLTRHTDYETFVIRDVVDSLELAKLIPPQAKVLDVGTGGGVPGVIIAIMRPDLHVELCESVAKRAKVVAEIVATLELPIPVYNARAEDLLGDAQFDIVVARAVAPLAKMLAWFADCWPGIGQLLLIKGTRWTEERGEARHRGVLKPLELRVAATYLTPVTGAENVILRIWPKSKAEPVA
jgi:16S rRNA (guanine527-N7)-methyltransferase